MFDSLKENWRMADGKDGICWPWSQKPSIQNMYRDVGWRGLGFSASLTGAWGRPYVWVGPWLFIF